MYVDVICSWCNKLLGTKYIGKAQYLKTRVTHTICSSCKEQVMREYKENLKQPRPEQRHHL
ncbi:MAG: hypothetical protein JXL81_03690 [Deltaproteobacteria bacterium]|nr:hypothetical protein [Deltaproteobacteria bacterium]